MKRMLALAVVAGLIASLAGLCFACGDERRITAVREGAGASDEIQGTDIIQAPVFVHEGSDAFTVQLDKFAPEPPQSNLPQCTGLDCLWVLLGRI